MRDEERSPSTHRRAQRYLRWYPAAWRARYGEEFVAHLEDELNEHAFSMSRGLDIALHGVATRLRVQRAARAVVGLSAVVISLLVILTLLESPGASRVPMRVEEASGVSTAAHPSRSLDVTFELTLDARARVRFTKIAPVPLRGYSSPTVVGADVANSFGYLFTADGWPLTLSSAANDAGITDRHFKNALRGSVTLGRTNTVLIGLAGATVGGMYAVSGWKMTYEYEGRFFTFVVKQNKTPDSFCVTPASDRSPSTPSWCSERSSAIQELATYGTSKTEWPHSEALVVQGAAMQYATARHRAATLSDAKMFAARLFPPHSYDGIQLMTETDQGSSTGAQLHFVMREGNSSRVRRACVYQGVYDSNSRGSWNSVMASPCRG